MKKQLRGSLLLLFATLIWGSTFIAQSVGMDYIGPFTFQAVRCFLAVIAMLPCIYLFDQLSPEKGSFRERWMNPKLWTTGSLCGIALFVAANLQQIGLVDTDAGKAGFITALYIVLVPILGLVFHKRPGISAWISVAIAVIGLYMLSCTGTTGIERGDLLLMGCALAFAIQITLVDRLAGNLDGLRVNCIQALVCATLSVPFMLLTETVDWNNLLHCWFPLFYAGVLSMGVAYSLQILGQQSLDPTPASLIMSMEAIFAALCGWLLLNERMNSSELLGCALVLAGVIISQIPIKKRT